MFLLCRKENSRAYSNLNGLNRMSFAFIIWPLSIYECDDDGNLQICTVLPRRSDVRTPHMPRKQSHECKNIHSDDTVRFEEEKNTATAAANMCLSVSLIPTYRSISRLMFYFVVAINICYAGPIARQNTT